LVGKTIKKANAVDDNNVFGKVGTTGAAVAAALTGKKVCILPNLYGLDLTRVGPLSRVAGEILLVCLST